MKKISLLIIIFIIYSLNITLAQTTPTIAWQNTIGGNNLDHLQSIKQTKDGGYIIGGHSASGISGDKKEASQGDWDYWVVKLDRTGQTIEWQNTIGGNSIDKLESIEQTTDGGYILGGRSLSGISGDKTEANLGDRDYWIVKLNGKGKVVWQNTIGGNNGDHLASIQQTTDGGYILGGSSNSGISGDKTEANQGNWDYWVVKLDRTGQKTEWQNTIGGSSTDYLNTIQQTTDGGYILGGHSASGISGDKTETSKGYYDYWIIKLNDKGKIVWQNTIGGTSMDELASIHQTTDGGYILGGRSLSGISGDKTEANLGDRDYWIVKLDDKGKIVWQNTIGGTSDDGLWSIQQTQERRYILGGRSLSGISGDKTERGQGWEDYWVVLLDGIGNIVWQNTIGGDREDYLYSVEQTTDRGYILGGRSNSGISGDKTEASQGASDYWVVKINADYCKSGSIKYDIETDKFIFCDDGVWIEE